MLRSTTVNPGKPRSPNAMVDAGVLHTPLDIDALPYAAFVIGGDGRITDVNLRGGKIVGYTRVELVGAAMSAVISDLAPPDLETRVKFARSVVAHHRSGREVRVDVVLCPHEHESQLALVTVVGVEDLHGLDLQQIVHDIKDPLSTITLEMSLLEDTLRDEGHANLCGAVTRVTHNVTFIDRLVQDLLDCSALDDGRFEIIRRPTEMRGMLEQVIDRSVSTREQARVVLDARCAVLVSIDTLRIERVVANLLHNALKYSPKPKPVVVKLDAMVDATRVSVIDAGLGMTTDEMSYVFEKYRRTSRALAHEGRGLGLFLSKQIIEAHGGRIGVESVNGAGSRFFFELPVM